MAGKERYSPEAGKDPQTAGIPISESSFKDLRKNEEGIQPPAPLADVIPVIETLQHEGMRDHLLTLIDNFPDVEFPLKRFNASIALADLYDDTYPSMKAFIEVLFTQRITPFVEVWWGKQKHNLVDERGLVAIAAAGFFKDEQTRPDRIIPTTVDLKRRIMDALSEEEYVAIFQKDDYQVAPVQGKITSTGSISEDADESKPAPSTGEQNNHKSQEIDADSIRNRVILKKMSVENLMALSTDLTYVRSMENIPSPVATLALRFAEGYGKHEIDRLQKGIGDMIHVMEHLGFSDVQELVNYLHDRRNPQHKDT